MRCCDAAEGWLRERGRDRMVGPMDFTTNDEIGLLIEGHEYPPIILCPWHHPYYQRLFERELGMVKAMDAVHVEPARHRAREGPPRDLGGG